MQDLVVFMFTALWGASMALAWAKATFWFWIFLAFMGGFCLYLPMLLKAFDSMGRKFAQWLFETFG